MDNYENSDNLKDDSPVRHRRLCYSRLPLPFCAARRARRVKKTKEPLASNTRSLHGSGTLDSLDEPGLRLVHYPSMPVLSHSNTTLVLEEACKRLEDLSLNSSREVKKSEETNASRSAVLDRSGTLGSQSQLSRPLTKFPSMPAVHRMKPLRKLEKAFGWIENTVRKYKMKKKHKCSAVVVSSEPNDVPATGTADSDYTRVGYWFDDDPEPYATRLPGTNITLLQFKELINPKRGSFRFFFKKVSNELGTEEIKEEISDDNQVLPLWYGKIFAFLEAVDAPNNATMTSDSDIDN